MERVAERLAKLRPENLRRVDCISVPMLGNTANFVASGGTAEEVRHLIARAKV